MKRVALLVAQAGPGHQRIGNMLLVAVAGVQHGGDAALRPVAGAVEQCAFGNDHDFARLREVQRHRQTGQSATNNGYIEFHGEVLSGLPHDPVAIRVQSPSSH